MSIDFDSYPLGRFLRQALDERGMTRSELCRRVAVKSVHRAFQSFDRFLTGRQLDPGFAGRVARALELEPGALEAAMEATRQQVADEAAAARERVFEGYRAAFVGPQLWVVPESRRPSSVLVVAAVGVERFRRAPLPDGLAELPLPEQLAAAGAAARAHFEAQRGSAGPFGRIVAYDYWETFDIGHRLTTSGEVLGSSEGHKPVIGCRLRGG